MANSLIGPIIGIRKPRFPTLGERFVDYGVTVVLRGHITALRPDLNAGLVLTAMAKF